MITIKSFAKERRINYNPRAPNNRRAPNNNNNNNNNNDDNAATTLSMVRLLLEQGANPLESNSYGKTAILFASKSNRCLDILKLLLDNVDLEKLLSAATNNNNDSGKESDDNNNNSKSASTLIGTIAQHLVGYFGGSSGTPSDKKKEILARYLAPALKAAQKHRLKLTTSYLMEKGGPELRALMEEKRKERGQGTIISISISISISLSKSRSHIIIMILSILNN